MFEGSEVGGRIFCTSNNNSQLHASDRLFPKSGSFAFITVEWQTVVTHHQDMVEKCPAFCGPFRHLGRRASCEGGLRKIRARVRSPPPNFWMNKITSSGRIMWVIPLIVLKNFYLSIEQVNGSPVTIIPLTHNTKMLCSIGGTAGRISELNIIYNDRPKLVWENQKYKTGDWPT